MPEQGGTHKLTTQTPVEQRKQAVALFSMQALRHVRQSFLQTIAAELSAGRAVTCQPRMQSQSHSSVAEPSGDAEQPHLQRFFKTASVAADPQVMVSTLMDRRGCSVCT